MVEGALEGQTADNERAPEPTATQTAMIQAPMQHAEVEWNNIMHTLKCTCLHGNTHG